MPFEFRLPDVGEGIDAAEILEWHVTVGDSVKEDDPLVDIQTDKAVVELPCPRTGTVLLLGGSVGDTLPVGSVLATFGDKSEPKDSPAELASAQPPRVQEAVSPPGGPRSGATGRLAAKPATPPSSSLYGTGMLTRPSPLNRPLASPAVRDAARRLGIDLARVDGSGPSGRILRRDLEPAASNGDTTTRSPAPTTAKVQSSVVEPRGDEVVALRGTRRVIARNMSEAWHTIPHIIDFRDVDMTALGAVRATLQDHSAFHDVRLTMMPLLSKIAATVVLRHPALNASIDEEREQIIYHGAVHLSVAISAPGGLVTPVILDADRKPIVQIATEMAALSAAARERRLSAAQLDGGTFMVNNYGALGSPLSTPIIRPGQAANLGFGKVTQKAVVRDGQVVARPIMGLSCSGDHRIMDGEHLASFCNELVATIENPILLLGDLS